MLGIVLAGGTGTRLWPITKVVSKQLLPIYDKPMIYYPISLLMASGIRDFVIITTPRDSQAFQDLLGNGNQWGVDFRFRIQERPTGLPDAFKLTADLTADRSSILMLGDNIFYGSQLGKKLNEIQSLEGASIFGYLVDDVSSFGTFEVSTQGKIFNLREKPADGGRGFAIPGVYKFDSSVGERASRLKPSQRGELEIIDLIKDYLDSNLLNHSVLDRGTAWLDTGTVEDMNFATELIRVIQSRQGMLIGSPEEVAFRNGWISREQLLKLGLEQKSTEYGRSLLRICES
jgi:glucose-1-phosphate thymidylyltransferase